MTTKLRSLATRHGLGFVSLLLVAGGLAALVAERGPDVLTITCRATNPGLELGPDDGHVFVHPEGRADEVVAKGELFEQLEVPQGRYDIRILLSRSRDRQSKWLRGVAVDVGEAAACDVAFSSGELQVDVTSAASGETGRMVAYVYAEDDHYELLASMFANESALIASGRYDVRVVLTEDSEEKEVQWLVGVEVETGPRTRIEVRFQRGTLLVLAENAAKELPVGAVTFNVHRADDEQREVLDSGTAGIPLSLPVGRYDVEVTFSASHDKPARWLYGLEIEDDDTCEQTVEFSSGAATVAVEIQNGGSVDDFSAYVYYYLSGDHEQPVAYTPPGGHAVLEAGSYDVRVSYLRSDDQPELWLRSVEVEPGEIATRTAVFASGRLLVRAYGGDGAELIGDNVFVYVYGAGQRAQPVAYARSGEILILTAGEYDVRAADTRVAGRELWLHSVRIRSGALTEKRVDFEND